MSQEIESGRKEAVKRGRGRPRKEQTSESRAERRPMRTPVSGHRDIITVTGKDPAYNYRWVNDYDVNGARIQRFRQASYEHVHIDEVGAIGGVRAENPAGEGTIVCKPTNQKGYFSYLMKIPKELYKGDQKLKQDDVLEKESSMKRSLKSGEDGRYHDKVEIG